MRSLVDRLHVKIPPGGIGGRFISLIVHGITSGGLEVDHDRAEEIFVKLGISAHAEKLSH